jgi:hypothetical protein
MCDELMEILHDPERLRTHIIEELRKKLEIKLRADDLRHFRLVYYGTEGSGDRIIPYAE